MSSDKLIVSALHALEHAAMAHAREQSRHTERRLNAARAEALAACLCHSAGEKNAEQSDDDVGRITPPGKVDRKKEPNKASERKKRKPLDPETDCGKLRRECAEPSICRSAKGCMGA